MRISNLALAITDVDTATGEIFIGNQAIKVDQSTLMTLVRSQLGDVAVQQAPASTPRRGRPAAVKAAPVSEVKRGPGRPPKAQAAAPATEKRGPGRPKKLVDAKVVKKADAKESKGKEGNGAHMAKVWADRRARAAKGLCMFCDNKHLPGGSFCKSHFQAKYPGKPLPTGK